MKKTYFIKTFGCAQNEADTQRIASWLQSRGMKKSADINNANHVIINTCMIREMAENRVYGTVYNLVKKKEKTGIPEKIIVTGCMVGMAVRDKSGKFMRLIKNRLPQVDEFLPIEEVGFDHAPIRTDSISALVPVSNGCNNFCTFCVVPFTRGQEISRPYEEIITECKKLAGEGYKKITLLGMNVNSYGADLVLGKDNIQVMRDYDKKYFYSAQNTILRHSEKLGYKTSDGKIIKPVYVKHLNRLRIPTLFPYLLDDICKIKSIEKIDFLSSNPWDFSDALIDVIARNPKITREIHLPVQSGSNSVLKRMNRWYTKEDYLELVNKLKAKIPAKGGSASGGKNLKLSTDIIVGFCGETEKEYIETVDMVKKAGFSKAYVAMYSDRPMTAAHKAFKDNVSHKEKRRRWQILEDLINKPNFTSKKLIK